MNNQLAIVIPFYKITFFESLLESLKRQTNQNFNVYIGNDCSPDDPDLVLQKYQKELTLTYQRFETRMGHISLTRQWDRCVGMIKDERWVWVLPDDDFPYKNCVEEFYQALNYDCINKVNVFRFPLNSIDQHGTLIGSFEESPMIEDNYQFYSRLLRGKTSSSLGDNIFRRSSLDKVGGFVHFPKAWGSDHATVLNVSSGGIIYCLQKASFGFRMSGENISSDFSDGDIKMKSRIAFAQWLKQHEGIFPKNPDAEFYRYFYWKGEHYALHEWKFCLGVWLGLYRLRIICIGSYNPLPIFKIMLTKLLTWGSKA